MPGAMDCSEKKMQPLIILIIIALTVGIFLLDFTTPFETAFWALYLVPLLLTFWVSARHAPVTLGAIVSGLTMLDAVYSLRDVSWGLAFFNRSMAAVVFVVTTALIVQRKKIEEALRKSEERFRALVEASPIATIISREADGLILYANEPMGRMFGLSAEEMIGCESPDFYADPVDRQVLLSRLQHGGALSDYEVKATRPGGKPFWVLVSIRRIIIDNEPMLLCGFYDITERKGVEEDRAKLAHDRLLLLESTGEGIFGIDAQGRCTFINQSAARMLGYGHDDLLGKDMHALIHHSRSDRSPYPDCECPIYRAFRAGRGCHVDDEVLWRRDGTSFPADYSSSPLLEGGTIKGAVVTFTDIAERKRAQESLQKSEARLQAILDFSPAMIFLKDSEGRYLHVNRQFERVFHIANEDILGKTDADVFPPPQAAAFRANDRRTLEAGEPLEFEEVALHDDGPHTSIVCKFPLRDASGKPCAIGGIATDITDRKRAEAIRVQLLDKVIVAQEEERRRIARELHDETEQALASLLIGLRTMEEASTLEEARRRVSGLRQVAAQSLDELQRVVLGLRPSLLDELGLAAALQRLCTEFAQTHNIRVELHVGSLDGCRLPPSMETALYRIVQEALTNMAKHAAATAVSVLIQLTASAIRVVVEDNGCGFDVEAVRQAAGPTGRLGLFGMQERAVMFGGTFTIESAAGQGTTIYVEVPHPSGALP